MSDIELYDVEPGETPMTHRAFRIGPTLINVFDSRMAADRFRKKQEGDTTILIRGHSYFARRNGVEMTVSLRREPPPESSHVLAAAKAVSDEVERMIARELAA
jgi:hypothetical protein